MKKVYVTDPCYLISNKDWAEICKKAEKEGDLNEWFDNAVTEKLQEISGDKCAVAGSTGHGDWVNEIAGREFCADSGMVCVVEITDSLMEYLDDYGITVSPWSGAIVDVPTMSLYEIDQSDPDWSVVKILYGGQAIEESLPVETGGEEYEEEF